MITCVLHEVSRVIFFALVSLLGCIGVMLLLPSDTHAKTFVRMYDAFITHPYVKQWYVASFHPLYVHSYNSAMKTISALSTVIVCAIAQCVGGKIPPHCTTPSTLSDFFETFPYYQKRTGVYLSDHIFQQNSDFSYLEVWMRLPRVVGDTAMPYVRYSERLLGLLFLSSVLSVVFLILFARQFQQREQSHAIRSRDGPSVITVSKFSILPWMLVATHLLLLLAAVEMAVERNLELPADAQHKLPGVHEATESLRFPIFVLLGLAILGAFISRICP